MATKQTSAEAGLSQAKAYLARAEGIMASAGEQYESARRRESELRGLVSPYVERSEAVDPVTRLEALRDLPEAERVSAGSQAQLIRARREVDTARAAVDVAAGIAFRERLRPKVQALYRALQAAEAASQEVDAETERFQGDTGGTAFVDGAGWIEFAKLTAARDENKVSFWSRRMRDEGLLD